MLRIASDPFWNILSLSSLSLPPSLPLSLPPPLPGLVGREASSTVEPGSVTDKGRYHFKITVYPSMCVHKSTFVGLDDKWISDFLQGGGGWGWGGGADIHLTHLTHHPLQMQD